MDALFPEYNSSMPPIDKKIHILLFGHYHTAEIRQTIEEQMESSLITEVTNDQEMVAAITNTAPDVIIVLTDYLTPTEIFNSTLTALINTKMNKRTIIISDNPFSFLSQALDAKVASLLRYGTDSRDLGSIIYQVRTSCQLNPKFKRET
jgi:AmiR/NasT family two-component response regulator